MRYNDQSSSTGKEKCAFFADFFESVYSSSTNVIEPDFSYMHDLPQMPDFAIGLTEQQVLIVLDQIDTKKSAGPDNISPIFLKNTAVSLSKP